MTKHDAMKEYFEPKVAEMVGDILNFNFSPESKDSVAFITNYSDKVRKKYTNRCGEGICIHDRYQERIFHGSR